MTVKAYTSNEDSALLRRGLEGYAGGSFLEIGAGNGGTLVGLAGRFRASVGTDLTKPDMSDWKNSGADFVLADTASCFRASTFDLVAFNPPYLLGESGDRAVDGGAAMEVPLRFLVEALRVVKKSGSVVFLMNDEAELGNLRAACSKAGFELELILKKKMFFEELAVYAASAKGPDRA